jgi:hypothetical protein
MFRSAAPSVAFPLPAQQSSRNAGRLLPRLVLAGAALCVAFASSTCMAQNSPGVPGGILDYQFQINKHPDMPFAASAPSGKYQSDKPSEARKRADNGDPDGCNLKCGPGN